jgi:hypothetical protein
VTTALRSAAKLPSATGAVQGIPQRPVSDLARGRLDKFSLEKLIDFVKRSGNYVEIRIKPSRKPHLKVRSAA